MPRKETCIAYNEMAEWFDSARNKALLEKKHLDSILVELPDNASVLDLGCGSGEPIAKYMIKAGCRITGIDGAENMIRLCRQRFPDYDWAVQDMRSFSRNKKYEAIIAWDCMFHLKCEDQRAMFPIFEKHSNSGTFLLFSCGWEEKEYWNPMRGKKEYEMFNASLDSKNYAELLDKHGFDVLQHNKEDYACGGRTYWLAQKR